MTYLRNLLYSIQNNIWIVVSKSGLVDLKFGQADEATGKRRTLEIEKEDTDELHQKYQVSSYSLPISF